MIPHSGDSPRRTVGRLQQRRLFQELGASSQRAACGPVRVVHVAAGESPIPLVGYAVGRRCGSAARRNRLRRRLRAVVAEVAPTLPAGAYLLSATAGAAKLSHAELVEAVGQAMTTAARVAEAVE